MIKTLISPALGVVLALGTVAPLHAESGPIDSWVDKVNQKIDTALMARFQEAEGDATVTFRRTSDGRAADVEAHGSSKGMEQAARRTVQFLRNLPPLPVGVDSNQRITMHILIGNDRDMDGFERKRGQIFAAAKVNNQQFAQRVTNSQVAMVNVAH